MLRTGVLLVVPLVRLGSGLEAQPEGHQREREHRNSADPVLHSDPVGHRDDREVPRDLEVQPDLVGHRNAQGGPRADRLRRVVTDRDARPDGRTDASRIIVGEGRSLDVDDESRETRVSAAADRRVTIAIDGPAAAGKSTIGEIVADRLNAVYFDTGILYRALTVAALQRGIAPDDEAALADCARTMDIRIERPAVGDGGRSVILLDGFDITRSLRTPDVDRNVSTISAHPSVRLALVEQQRAIGRSGRVVMVGRDIGSVVLPEADLKIFLDASVEERAHRRFAQFPGGASGPSFETVLADMRRRDEIDSTRDVAPLRPAVDAVVIDTDRMTIQQVADRVVALADDVLATAKRP
jgi:cytidylate kinase